MIFYKVVIFYKVDEESFSKDTLGKECVCECLLVHEIDSVGSVRALKSISILHSTSILATHTHTHTRTSTQTVTNSCTQKQKHTVTQKRRKGHTEHTLSNTTPTHRNKCSNTQKHTQMHKYQYQ